MKTIKELLATFFYLGYAPVASGTVGSLGPLGITFLMLLLPEAVPYGLVSIGLTAIFFVIGVPLGFWAERHYGVKDPSPFVLDEVMAYFIPLIPFGLWIEARPRWDELIAAFILSRLFDVVKPPPARRLESLPGGWGIMLDDMAAGIYALMGLMAWHSLRYGPSF